MQQLFLMPQPPLLMHDQIPSHPSTYKRPRAGLRKIRFEGYSAHRPTHVKGIYFRRGEGVDDYLSWERVIVILIYS